MSTSTTTEQPWVPIESDPDIMTQLIHLLTKSEKKSLIDVPIIEGAEEMGLFLDHKVEAFIFLYTINEKTESNQVGELLTECPSGLFHMKQVNKNACGTVALFHSTLNSSAEHSPDSIMGQFETKARPQDYLTRGASFSETAQIKELHEKFATFGQSNLPSGEELNNVSFHYVAIVPFQGHVYELDGRRPFPVKHREYKDHQFISAGLATIQDLIQRDPDNLNFSVLAFCSPA